MKKLISPKKAKKNPSSERIERYACQNLTHSAELVFHGILGSCAPNLFYH